MQPLNSRAEKELFWFPKLIESQLRLFLIELD